MFSILLTILKILGLILLAVLGIIFIVIILVLFVPVRYRLTVHRKVTEEAPVVIKASVTWLLHLISASFAYPEEAYVKLKLLCFTIFRSDKPKEKKKKASPETEKKEKETVKNKETAESMSQDCKRKTEEKKDDPDTVHQEKSEKNSGQQEDKDTSSGQTGISDFLKKLISALENIKYTIAEICDKIKHIIKNIRYYIDIIKSEIFQSAWSVCSSQVFSLLRSILPGKIQGSLTVGTGDPGSTGQVMAVYGILYPLLGNHIDITPDFEQQIVEGNLLIKGKITLFRLVKAAWIVYFNKDIRHLIKLFKKGGSVNGRE